jgi:hypothetical protein
LLRGTQRSWPDGTAAIGIMIFSDCSDLHWTNTRVTCYQLRRTRHSDQRRQVDQLCRRLCGGLQSEGEKHRGRDPGRHHRRVTFFQITGNNFTRTGASIQAIVAPVPASSVQAPNLKDNCS